MGTKRIIGLNATTDFEDDDNIVVDSTTAGTRKMAQSVLKEKLREDCLGNIHNLPTTITAFRPGDYIAVDGTDTAKMAKDDLLRVTAENAAASGLVATSAELADTNLNVKDVAERTENLHDYGEKLFAVTDPNGYIAFAVNKDGSLVGVFFSKFKESTENGFVVTDPNGYIGFSVDNEGNTTFKEKIDNDISLVLPSKIPAVQDRVNFFYYENILKNGWLGGGILVNSDTNTDHESNVFKVGSAGTQTVTYYAYYGEKIVASKSFNRVTISKAQAGSFKVCVLGDSKTDNASKLAQLLNICQQDGNLSVTLLGSITENADDADGNSRSVKNEGYSGSKVQNFCRSSTIAGNTNIFYDSTIADTNKFNFAKGVTALGDVPDILWIDLGANQANDSKSDVMGCYESIIQSVKDYNTANSTNVKVVISVQEFGGCLPYILSKGDGKKNLNSASVKVEDYISQFDNRESEGVFICPQYVCIDPFNDYPMTDIPESVGIGSGPMRRVALDIVHPGINTNWYNSATTYNVGSICKTTSKVMALCLKDGTIGVAPTDDKVNWALTIGSNANLGYFKLAEMYFATLKYIASL